MVKPLMKNRFRVLLAISFLSVFPALFADLSMVVSSSGYIYHDSKDLPENKCGLLLGTSKYRSGGGVNPYFKNRIEAAVKLFRSGKIEYIIASGDNSEKYYNEPKLMRKELIGMGVPAGKIVLDFAGFRTLDSVVRAKHVFGQDSITVISQRFHLERAIYLGRKNNLQISGFVAESPFEAGYIKVRVREVLARTKAYMDIHILKKQPKFLGEKVSVP